jgi:phosphoribosyl-ATP pyrophosphohydrolase
LIQVIKERKANRPEGSYTTHLFNSGIEKIRKKTGEEAIELILARRREDIAYEAADLIYHLLVLLEAEDIDLGEVLEELSRRRLKTYISAAIRSPIRAVPTWVHPEEKISAVRYPLSRTRETADTRPHTHLLLQMCTSASVQRKDLAIGLAMPFPAISGAEPPAGS